MSTRSGGESTQSPTAPCTLATTGMLTTGGSSPMSWPTRRPKNSLMCSRSSLASLGSTRRPPCTHLPTTTGGRRVPTLALPPTRTAWSTINSSATSWRHPTGSPCSSGAATAGRTWSRGRQVASGGPRVARPSTFSMSVASRSACPLPWSHQCLQSRPAAARGSASTAGRGSPASSTSARPAGGCRSRRRGCRESSRPSTQGISPSASGTAASLRSCAASTVRSRNGGQWETGLWQAW
mmetsp:Transcript_115571/g.321965  ORF Transcript_115571/g.321965 Transcript_115571/m.321965 type:complete len:238 (-) Transcript_115571:265-978(-)